MVLEARDWSVSERAMVVRVERGQKKACKRSVSMDLEPEATLDQLEEPEVHQGLYPFAWQRLFFGVARYQHPTRSHHRHLNRWMEALC